MITLERHYGLTDLQAECGVVMRSDPELAYAVQAALTTGLAIAWLDVEYLIVHADDRRRADEKLAGLIADLPTPAPPPHWQDRVNAAIDEIESKGKKGSGAP